MTGLGSGFIVEDAGDDQASFEDYYGSSHNLAVANLNA